MSEATQGIADNNAVGNAWLVHVLSVLLDRWPRRTQMEAGDVISATGLSLDASEEDEEDTSSEAFVSLVNWMRDEGLIRFREASHGYATEMILTAEGFALLGKPSPSAAQKTIGDRVRSAAKDIASTAAKEGAKSVAKDAAKEASSIVGELIGSIAGSFTRSVGGGGTSV